MWHWNDGTMELYHYGVKGMKWGVRKARPQGDTTGMVRRKQNTSSELRELQGYAKHPSKLGSSKVSTAIRNHQIKTLQKKAEINKNIKDYRKKYDSASAQSDHADALWKDAKAKYNALGRNRVERVLATIQNKSAAAKEYNTAFNKANSASDRADAAWAKSKEAYAKTGKNAVSRVINNIRYDTRR